MIKLNIEQNLSDKLRQKLDEQAMRMSDPAIAANPSAFRALIKSHSHLKKIMEKMDAILRTRRGIAESRELISGKNSDSELRELAQEELSAQEEALPGMERELLMELAPADPADHRNTIMEIRAGAGGQEASIFAGDLLRMYTHYAEARGWRVELIDASPSEVGGYKEVVFSLQGENVFRDMQFESGTHRVQRVPVTEACGRIHTSTVTVAVLPEADELDKIVIKPEDLKTDVYRASGAGGQHVNKTDSAVRITHMPSGIVVASQEERSQHKNRAKAMRLLRAHLFARQRDQAAQELGDERRSQIGTGDRSERIRTYNFPQNRLTDHRINYTAYNLNRVMEGDITAVLQALRESRIEQRLQSGLDLNQLVQSF